MCYIGFFFFFFQAEDGIRDWSVTGVQTCALPIYDEILKTNPNDEKALVYQSQMQISKGDVNNATQTLQTVIKNAPKNSEAHYALGVAFEKLGNLENAESEWREALRLRPNLLDAQRALAN